MLFSTLFLYSSRDDVNLDVVAGRTSLNTEFIQSWANYLYSNSTSELVLFKNNQLLLEVERTLGLFTSVSKLTFPLGIVHYDQAISVATVYRVQSVWFDLGLSIAVGIYLVIFATVLQQPKNFTELRKIFGF